MGSLRSVRSILPLRAPAPDSGCVDVFEQELDYLYRTLQRLGARPADIDDLLQDIFLILYRNWSTLDTTRPLWSWLFGGPFRVRRPHRRGRGGESCYEGMDPLDDAPSPESWLQGQESL